MTSSSTSNDDEQDDDKLGLAPRRSAGGTGGGSGGAPVRNSTPARYKLPKGAKAIASDTPGETKELTFYKLGSRDCKAGITIVDMPGYGYAAERPGGSSASGSGSGGGLDDDEDKDKDKDDKRTAANAMIMPKYDEMAMRYVTNACGRPAGALKRLLLLLDSRHGIKEADRRFLTDLEAFVADGNRAAAAAAAASSSSSSSSKSSSSTTTRQHAPPAPLPLLRVPPIQLVLTKADLVSQVDLARRVVLCRSEVSSLLKRQYGDLSVMVVSARAGVGYNNVKNFRGVLDAKGGVLQMQREIAGLVPTVRRNKDKAK